MGSAGKGGESRADDMLSATAREAFAEGQPLRTKLMDQQLEALTTGGVGAQLPIITASQSQSREATSRALTGTQEDLARRGLSRTPYAGSTMANTRLQGEQTTSMIPSQIAQAFIAGAPTSSFAGMAPGLSGLGTAAGVSAQRDIAKGNQSVEYMKAISSMAAAAAGACWIAASLYGEGSAKWSFARWYIFVGWKHPMAPVVRAMYRRWGQRLARSRVFCAVVRPLFDVAVRRGAAELSRGI